MTLAELAPPSALLGHPRPRIAPPIPARSDIAGYREIAASIGMVLMPWQEEAVRYLEALGEGTRHLFREVAIVVSRQNGKSSLLVPLIVKRLLEGRRIMHTAQDRTVPMDVYEQVAAVMFDHYRDRMALRNGRPTKPKFGSGKEEIRTIGGGQYAIVAPTRSGARGHPRDLVIVDEVREMLDWDFIAAAKPTLTVSSDPQMIYLSNAGTDGSIVLNALRERADKDPVLAYLEWSASPERTADDRAGWAEANPAMGHEVGEMGSVLETLETEYRTALLEGTMAVFETEHLCRWVPSMRERLVDEYAWSRCEADIGSPRRPVMAVSMDPSGERASAVIAWQEGESIAMRVVREGVGHPIDPDELGADLKRVAAQYGIREVGYDPLTDGQFAKYFKKPHKMQGSEFANACADFVTRVNAGRLKWSDAASVTDDLIWTAQKANDESGSFQAVRAKDDRPIPAALAAIRAVYLASGPKATRPRIY